MSNEAVVTTKKVNVRYMVQCGMLGGVATLLMLFEIPLWFAPSFYEIDLSEVAVLVGTFAMGPLAGIVIETIKILLNFILNGTVTAGVGELANLLFGISLVVPAGIIYGRNKTRKGATVGLVVGTIIMTLVGAFMNAYILLPVYATAFGMPLETIVGMGTAVNPAITGLGSFILLAVVPFNILKGVIVSLITLLIYKKLSPILKPNR